MRAYLSKGNIYGELLVLVGFLILFPIIIIPFYPQESIYFPSFALPALCAMGLGLIICLISKPSEETVYHRWQSSMQKGSLPVLFAWCCGFAGGAAPFVVSGQMNTIHALFESISGWTTTGLTVANVAEMPYIFLFHRSFMQYCGGLGFILMILMLVTARQAISLFDAEGHPDRLMPSLKRTVRAIVTIYVGFFLLGTLSYVIFGMKVFDAVCYTMSALSTAGFATNPQSIGAYNSFPIEFITIVLMLIGAMNFAALLLLSRFKFKKIGKISELRFMFALIAVFVPLIAFSLIFEAGMGVVEGFRQSLFGVVTTFTTTGYATTANYAAWPPFSVGLIIVLMFIGGSIGSTAGGIKLVRTYLLCRIAWASIQKRMSPSRRIITQSYYRAQGKTPIGQSLVLDTVSFAFYYIAVFLVGTLLMTLTESCSLTDAAFEFSSALGTVGISNGMTNLSTKPITLIIEMVGMVLGRLEIFIVFIGIHTGVMEIAGLLPRPKSRKK